MGLDRAARREIRGPRGARLRPGRCGRDVRSSDAIGDPELANVARATSDGLSGRYVGGGASAVGGGAADVPSVRAGSRRCGDGCAARRLSRAAAVSASGEFGGGGRVLAVDRKRHEPATDQPAGTWCWMETSSQPGCYVWILGAIETATWAGACPDGLAQGAAGSLTLAWDDYENVFTWLLQAGKQPSDWVLHYSNGELVSEGPFVDGERHGHALSTVQRRVMTAIEQYRIGPSGGHTEQCNHGGKRRVSDNSCGNRYCPGCRSLARNSPLRLHRQLHPPAEARRAPTPAVYSVATSLKALARPPIVGNAKTVRSSCPIRLESEGRQMPAGCPLEEALPGSRGCRRCSRGVF